MPKKTFALIFGLVLVTVILFIIALNKSGEQATVTPSSEKPLTQVQVSPTSAVPAHSVLSLSPNPLAIVAGEKGIVDVDIDTSDNEVTAVQLEIEYDPTYITNVKVIPGSLFAKPVVLFDKNDVKEGRITYMYGIAPNAQVIKGRGIAATISFTALKKIGDTQLNLLPTTLVTARGVSDSVLKQSSGTSIKITSTSQDTMTNTQDATTGNNASSMSGSTAGTR